MKLERILKKYMWRMDLLDEWKSAWESTMRNLKVRLIEAETSRPA